MSSFKTALLICGLSQEEAASYFGVSKGRISAWCNGSKEPPAPVWIQLSELFEQIDEASEAAAEAIVGGEVPMEEAARGVVVGSRDDPLPGSAGEIAGVIGFLRAIGDIAFEAEEAKDIDDFIEKLLSGGPGPFKSGKAAMEFLGKNLEKTGVDRPEGATATEFASLPFRIDYDKDGNLVPIPMGLTDDEDVDDEPDLWGVALCYEDDEGRPTGMQVAVWMETEEEAYAEAQRLNGKKTVH